LSYKELTKQASKAAKWSTVTELTTKLVTPITNMILARILAPEAFGVVVTVTMIISFAEMFTDAGFQKYLIQHEFKSEEEKVKNTTVAFWTNLGISFLLWGVIALLCEPIATLVGNPGLGIVIIIACIQLPLTSFSSIQMALYKREFDFITLFWVRIITSFIPFVVTIPLALLGYSYWALVIGTICSQLANAVILTSKSKWKPSLFYSVVILKEMLSFSIWSLIEAISIWLTIWLDALLIVSVLNDYYLGLYKTSTTMVNALLALITASVIPILFSALSRLQNDEPTFKEMFYKVQRAVAYLVLPMGFGVFLYSDVATQVLLGNQWTEANNIIGIWALTSSILIVTSHFNSEVYRAKGNPKLSFASQVIHLLFLIPTCLISLNYGFWVLVYARALIRFEGVITGLIIMNFAMHFPVSVTLENLSKPFVCTLIMCCLALLLKQISDSLLWSFASMAICALVYTATMFVLANKDFNVLKGFIKEDIT